MGGVCIFGSHIFSCLIHMALHCGFGVRIVFEDILGGSNGQLTKFPASMALTHVDLMAWIQTAFIHHIAFLMDGRSYMLMAWCKVLVTCLQGG